VTAVADLSLGTLGRGTVRHQRFRAPRHLLTRKITMVLADVAQLDFITDRSRWWSTTKRALVSLTRQDFLPDTVGPLDDAARDLVEAHLGFRPLGRVVLCAQVRTWGVGFNPIRLYYCHDADDAIVALIAEVTNTPWGERHCYVVGSPGSHHFTKTFHVSPFLDMDLDYDLTYGAPGRHLTLSIAVAHGDEQVLSTGLALTLEPLTPRAMTMVARQPLRGPLGSLLAIYRHAVVMVAKRARYHTHPKEKQHRD